MAATKPAEILTKAATEYATAKAGDVIGKLGDKASGTVSKATSTDSGDTGDNGDGEDKKGFIGNTAEKLGEGASPVGAAVKGLGSSIKEGVKGLFSRKGGAKRPHNIVEDVFIGVPPDVCFEAFTTWEEFPSFMKGPTSVTRGDETPEDDLEEGQHPLEGEQTNWKGKVFLSTREQTSTTVDYDPPERVSWKSEGSKGTIDGTVTFTPIGENATLMLVVLEYRSKGPVEWIANRWRAVGRRCRLDLKHFRRYVMRTEPDELPEPEEPEEPTDEVPEEPTDEVPDETPEEPTDEEPTDETPEEPEPEEPTDETPEEPEPEEPEPEPAQQRSRPARRPRG